jgi:hypothetical protein
MVLEVKNQSFGELIIAFTFIHHDPAGDGRKDVLALAFTVVIAAALLLSIWSPSSATSS